MNTEIKRMNKSGKKLKKLLSIIIVLAAVIVLAALIAGDVYLGYKYHKSNKERQQPG